MAFKEYKRLAKRDNEDFSSPEILLEEIKKKNFKPIMIFFGAEKMRIENAVDYIRKSLLGEKSNDFNYEVFYCESESGVRIYQSFVTPSFLGGNKLILAREAEKLREENYTELIKTLRFEKFNGTLLILIYYTDELSVKGKSASEFIKQLKKGKAVYRFEVLGDSELMKKVQNYLKKYEMTIEPDGFSYLVQELGYQQDVIFNILSQLVMYDPSKKKITLQDIRSFVFNFRGFTVYDFTNAIANKRIDEALRILEISGNSKENLIQLVQPIMKMLEQLYITKSLMARQVNAIGIAQRLKIPLKIVESEFIPQAR
ncbi:MAG: DNA polymerase III subunit delta, partial [Deltaproteobacteria bacterium]|nr:DNA polymerase III subunit delta [Deltaproteobacteria bacterium]